MNNKILEKISNLLARADAEQNDNPHEREIAMKQANALLTKHGLSITDVSDKVERKDSFGALGRKKHDLTTKFVWETGVWNEIASLNACKIIKTPRKGLNRITIVGRQLNCVVVQRMAEYVVNSIKREAKNQGRKLCSFGNGAWFGVADQVEKIIEERKKGIIGEEQVSQETALMIIDQHKQALIETEKTFKDFYPNTKSGGSYSYKDNSDISAGREYGSKIGLNNQIENDSRKQLN